ncbi:MAG: hypothetical protein KIS61_10215 [Candidatus Eremiobacteraeota bacterium]|nr:hypothetical protein [Candidatus Eremiobacteraeota bacterium]
MKILKSLMSGGIIASCFIGAWANHTDQSVIQGTVQVQSKDGSWRDESNPGAGASIRTQDADATLNLAGAQIRLAPHSQVKIVQMNEKSVNLRLSETGGRVFVHVPKDSSCQLEFGKEVVKSGESEFVVGYGKSVGVEVFSGTVTRSEGVKSTLSATDWEGQGAFADADADEPENSNDKKPDDPQPEKDDDDDDDDIGAYAGGGAAAIVTAIILLNGDTEKDTFLASASP